MKGCAELAFRVGTRSTSVHNDLTELAFAPAREREWRRTGERDELSFTRTGCGSLSARAGAGRRPL